MSGPIEQKAVAGPFATLVGGYLSSLLITAVPWLHQHLTSDQQQALPIIIAFLLAGLAAYFAPHTHRPDLMTAAETLADETVTAVQAAKAPPQA
jgi:thiamine transporter ThiT